jgi:hypothetical protein
VEDLVEAFFTGSGAASGSGVGFLPQLLTCRLPRVPRLIQNQKREEEEEEEQEGREA